MQPNRVERTAAHTPGRAQRYPLQLPVQFRAVTENEWQTGSTENLSDSGAIIRAATQLMPATVVEFVITLPSVAGHVPACLVGEGRVVRSLSLVAERPESAFAVTFTHYRLERTGTPR